MALHISETASLSDVGRERGHNEDSFIERSPLFAVADGMGGARAGEVASQLAIEALGALDHTTVTGAELGAAARDANQRINQLALEDPSRAGMGTTMTAVVFTPERLTVGHVGDSRLYRLRDGALARLTRDHSLVAELVERGELTLEEAERHPARSMLLRALGPEPEVEIDTKSHSVQAGDLYLICSDGLTSMVPDDKLSEVLGGKGSVMQIASGLINVANASGGRDNITVVLFRLANGSDPAATIVAGQPTLSSPPS